MVYLTRILLLLWREAREMHERNKTFPGPGKRACRRVPGFHNMVRQAVSEEGGAVEQGWMTVLRILTHGKMAL